MGRPAVAMSGMSPTGWRPTHPPVSGGGGGGANTPFIADYYALEILSPTAALSSNHRVKRAYTGIPYEVRVAVIGGSYPYTYSLSNAPSGMSIDADTGVISWPSPASTATDITVTVTDSSSGSVSETWTITVGTSGFAFVDAVGGSDSNAGTLAAPWQTLQKVYDAPAHTIVYFRAGTYNWWNEVSSGARQTYGQSYGNSYYLEIAEGVRASQFIGYPGDTRPVWNFGYVAGVSEGVFLEFGGDNHWVSGIACTAGHAYLFKGGSGEKHTFYDLECYGFEGAEHGNNSAMWSNYVADSSDPPIGNIWQNIHAYDSPHALMIQIYTKHKLLVEDCTCHDMAEFFQAKANCSQFTVRRCNIYDIASYTPYGVGGVAISGNMNSETPPLGNPPYRTYGEYCYNRVNVAFVSGTDGVVFDLSQTGIQPWGPLYLYRNTFEGRCVIASLPSVDYGPMVLSNNVIVNEDGAETPYAYIYDQGTILGTITLTNNLGAPAASAVTDASGNLQGSARTLYLGTRGWEVP